MSQKRNDKNNEKYTMCVFMENRGNGKEEEQKTVVPKRWVDEEKEILWWPNGFNVTCKKNSDPDKSQWLKFPLVKIVIEGEESVCNQYMGFTSSSSSSETEDSRKRTSDASFDKTKKVPEKPEKSLMEVLKNGSSKFNSPIHSRAKSRSSRPVTPSRPRTPIRDSGSPSPLCSPLPRSPHSHSSHHSSHHHSSHHSESSRHSRSPPIRDSGSPSPLCSPLPRSPHSHSSHHSSHHHSSHQSESSRHSRSPHHPYSSDHQSSSPAVQTISRRDVFHSGSKPSHLDQSHSPSITLNTSHQSSKSSTSRSNDRSKNDSRKDGQRKDSARILKQKFPMDQGEFQKLVVTMLLDRQEGCRCKCSSTTGWADERTDVIDRIESMEKFNQFEEKLKGDKEEYNKLVHQLKKVGGKTLKENTKNVMARIMDFHVMANFNMKGKNRGDLKKIGFEEKMICKAILDAIQPLHGTSTETAIKEQIANVLKFSPFSQGGGKPRNSTEK